ncbi:GNAT family N-acetyltransferase [Rhizobium sp.]
MTVEVAENRIAATRANSRAPEAVKPVLGRLGSLETRLAVTPEEVRAAQVIRYRVFVEEMGARLPPAAMLAGLDFDAFDDICDHLIVLDTSLDGDAPDQIVATYRLLRQEVAEKHSGFYSADEFDIAPMIARHPGKRFLELGRSCVLPPYRTKRTVELLWQGNWAYALKHNLDVMIGCASFPGAFPEFHALALSFLHHNTMASGDWTVRAAPNRYRNMDLMPSEAVNPKRALMAMPPLVKGYLRLGAMVGEGAVVDHAFGTTDVLIVLPVESISSRYVNYYGADAQRFAS